MNGVSSRVAAISTSRPRNRSPRLRRSAPGTEPGFGEHLEPVADTEDEPAVGGERLDRPHHRAEPGDDARAQIVAVGEAAGQDDRGDAVE